ncbi:hypothetical protein MIB92_13220 [Aestuariirhabdus sp. Z084]|uniref:hypothetical protein n=1 Tax=Aestuariirhabdus haliotis TaxID=2918751 RepID=UPI00201B405A|nr:hypothetical protein [Aestuariirhabdus haliotis]MCL6416614.1 hypothetical protein [Aestuariirhabdus haliotis]MCL6420649.1 hypothetical protein [Aestuariirhabdus haliotis]
MFKRSVIVFAIVLLVGLLSVYFFVDFDGEIIKETEVAPVVKKDNSPKKKINKKPLDLSVPLEANNASSVVYTSARSNVLPNLFSQNKSKEEIVIGGRILSDPIDDDSFSGAEVTVEVSIY